MKTPKIERASERASKFKAYKTESGAYQISSAPEGVDQSRSDLRGTATYVTVTAKVKSVTWAASISEYRISLDFLDLSIGHSAEEGWDSLIGEDCLFVIDGNSVRHLPIERIHVSTEKQFAESRRSTAHLKSLEKNPNAEYPSPPVEPDGSDTYQPYAAAVFNYLGPMPGFWLAEYSELSIGLPDAAIQKIVDLTLKGLQVSVILHGIGVGLTSSFEYGSARDLFLVADGEPLKFNVDSVGIEIRPHEMSVVDKQDPPTNQEMEPTLSEAEKLQPALQQLNQSVMQLRTTVLTAAWSIGIVLFILAFLR